MWDWLVNIIFWVLQLIQSVAQDWGLSIIILTVLIRLILTPLTIKSTKSTAKMQVLQPKLQQIQERYADDPQRQAEELQKFYSQNKFNPLGGCLPLILQMPVFFALFSVLRDRIPDGGSFFGIIPELAGTPGGMFGADMVAAIPYLVVLALFGVLTLIPQLINTKNQTGAQASSMRTTAVIMAVFMIIVGWNLPAGVLLYYDTSSAWGVVQQLFITRKVMDKFKAEEEERLANAPIEVDVVRREKKQRPHKKR